jgi:hypothetical protein
LELIELCFELIESFLVLPGIGISGHDSLAFVDEIGNFFYAYLNVCQFVCVVILSNGGFDGKDFKRADGDLKLILFIIDFKHLLGELCLSPCGLDLINKFLI